MNYKGFEIKYSDKTDNAATLICPDIGICDQCLNDIKNIKNRRYKYPFTNCTNCGPRFSIIKDLPYDRNLTTMDEFKMCSECNYEYRNPLDRRFHAQPNACKNCGPKLELVDKFGRKIIVNNPIKEAVKYIKQGKIVAVKGLGGFHLTCDAQNKQSIQTLRDRKHRPTKPLAVMMKNINSVKKYCYLSKEEENTISNNKKPILILNKKEEKLSNKIAPNTNKLGVMLPYTPLHYLLFEEEIEVLVMTSANVSNLPIIYKNEEALEKLNNIADYLLMHNRDIYIPVDDSVSKVVLGRERVIRNSRGYSPLYIKLDGIKETLACGAHLKNTFAVSKNENIIISQYIGDMENLETCSSFEKIVSHFKKVYDIIPEVAAYDMHPDYWLTKYANKQDTKKVAVQHHHAHIVSCMVENRIKDKIIGIAYDGIGYGTDKKLWGSEFLICDYKSFERAGHINYVSMPGGDAAVEEPWKMALSYLYKTYKKDTYKKIPHTLRDKNIKPIIAMIKNDINSPKCSSMGRFFDAAAALTGFSGKVTFEGEAAILLENIADKNENSRYYYDIEYINQKYILNTNKIIEGIIEDVNQEIDLSIISKKFHNTVIDFSVKICKKIAQKYNIQKAALSGGVFQNEILLKGIYEELISQGFEVYTHNLIPCNDSGICLGQLAVANANVKG